LNLQAGDPSADNPLIPIHRLVWVVHLLLAMNCLFVMYVGRFCAVIYIVIKSKMAARINKQSVKETSRMALIVGGVIVAILVSPFLIKDADVRTHFSILPHVSSATKHVAQNATSLIVDAIIINN
jgi:hypothetical protein